MRMFIIHGQLSLNECITLVFLATVLATNLVFWFILYVKPFWKYEQWRFYFYLLQFIPLVMLALATGSIATGSLATGSPEMLLVWSSAVKCPIWHHADARLSTLNHSNGLFSRGKCFLEHFWVEHLVLSIQTGTFLVVYCVHWYC